MIVVNRGLVAEITMFCVFFVSVDTYPAYWIDVDEDDTIYEKEHLNSQVYLIDIDIDIDIDIVIDVDVDVDIDIDIDIILLMILVMTIQRDSNFRISYMTIAMMMM